MSMAQAFHRVGIMSETGSFPAYTTVGNGYVSVGIWNGPYLKTKRLRLAATGNDLEVTILGSFDGGNTFPITVLVTTDIAAAAETIQTITDWYSALDIHVRPNVAGVHGTLTVTYGGANF